MLLKGLKVADSFYPFVDNGMTGSPEAGSTLEVHNPARIAVFDDVAAAPRVVVVEPSDIRTYLEEITATVTKLAKEQGGGIPFTVIREVVENLIHAYFIEPTVSILDGGNTIRFSDQGPGIQDKERALEFGTTSATAEMKLYIRGVGSGLPYAQQWLEDKGGSLTVEDNIHNGTVVTISLVRGANQAAMPQDTPIYQQQFPQQPQYQGWQGSWQQPQQQGWPQQQIPSAAQAWPQQATPQPWPQQAAPQGWQQAQAPQAPMPQAWPQQAGQQPAAYAQAYDRPPLSDREQLVMDYLRSHESVGPRDLVAIYQLSESTWSRALSQLEAKGLVSKRGGQKRYLTAQGRALLGI